MGDKYVGLDVHQSSTVAAGLDEKGRLVMESVLETKARTTPAPSLSASLAPR